MRAAAARFALLLIAVVTVLSAPLAAAATTSRHSPVGHLRVLLATGYLVSASVAIDDRPTFTVRFGQTSPYVALTAAEHGLTVTPGRGSATASVIHLDARVEPDGWTTVVLVHNGGASAPASSIVLDDEFPRLTARHAAVRFVSGTADEPKGGVIAGKQSLISGIAPLHASQYAPVTSGRTLLTLRSASGEVLLSVAAALRSGSDYSLVDVGGGDVPIQLRVFTDAAQPPQLARGQVINTGAYIPPRATDWRMPTLLLLTAFAAILWAIVHRRRRTWLIALAVGLTGCATLKAAPNTTPVRSAHSPPGPTVRASKSRAMPGGVQGEQIIIPAIGVDAPVVTRPMSSSDVLYKALGPGVVASLTGPDSTEPGAVGIIILAGHVNFGPNMAPAVFAHLSRLAPGDAVVIRDGNRSFRYTVTTSGEYPKDALPAAIFASVGDSELRLITCAGPIGADGLHENNYIVSAGLSR